MSIETKVDGLLKTVEEFKSINEKRIAELEKKGFETSETQSQLAKANAEIDRLSDEVKKVHTAMNRHEVAAASESSSNETKAAFRKWISKGVEGMDAQEQKALSVQSDVDGGYLVLPEMSNEIVKKVFESSPVRQVASVASISTDTLEIIQDLDEAAAGWVTETAARAQTASPQFKKLIIAAHEMYANAFATQKFLDDAFVNPEAWLAEKYADKFSRIEASAFVSGDGVNKPRGFLTYAAGTGYEQIEQVNSGDADDVTADGLINLVTALKAFYKPGAAFMMKRATLGEIRKLKDLEGQYLWQPALSAGNPDLILGYPVYEADDMEAEGANALAVAFGNFRAGYQIVDRFGIRTLRDPYSSKPYVSFYSTKRVGGGVKNFEAIKILKCAV